MKTTSTDAHANQRVEGDTVGVAGQSGLPTPNLGEDQGNTLATLSLSEDVGEYAPAISMGNDDIGPDDAPEVMWEEDDGEVRDFISIGAMKYRY
jgi:hypothetical protein